MTNDPRMQSSEASARTKLDEQSLILLDLHQVTIEAEARNFDPVGGPLELLNLTVAHPQFAWLRALTTLIAVIARRCLSDRGKSIENLRQSANPMQSETPGWRSH